MTFYPWYHLPTLACGGAALAFAIVAWRNRRMPAMLPISALLFALALWTLASAGEIGANTEAGKLFWVKVEYPGIAFSGMLWFVFILDYCGYRTWLSRRNLAILSIIPGLSILFNWTSPYHQLIYTRIAMDYSHGLPLLALTYGPWFYVLAPYAYLMNILGLVLCIHALLMASPYYRRQAVIIFIAALFPIAINAVYLLRLGPIPYLDLTPIAFTVTAGMLVLGMMRFRLGELMPVAHKVIVNSIADGVLVIDSRGHVIEMNPAAARLLNCELDATIGAPIHSLTAIWEAVAPGLDSTEDTVREQVLPGTARVVEVRVMAISRLRFGAAGRVVLLRDITERRYMEERLQTLAFFDQLTGLPNRALFMDRLEQVLMRAKRNGAITAVLFIDLDRFKEINDTLGHSAGDLLLQQVAQRLTACVRASDTVARLGGDEFVIILPDQQNTNVTEYTTQRLLAAFTQPFPLTGGEYFITPSIGISFAPIDGTTVERLMQHADMAMYDAKHDGRNTYRRYTPV